MYLEILTPEKNGINLPGTSGGFELLNNHAPIISALDKGTIKINAKEGVKTFTINSGFVECLNNKVTVLVEGVSDN
jgi:F-type H+-transporting ATPase subunit epsilon